MLNQCLMSNMETVPIDSLSLWIICIVSFASEFEFRRQECNKVAGNQLLDACNRELELSLNESSTHIALVISNKQIHIKSKTCIWKCYEQIRDSNKKVNDFPTELKSITLEKTDGTFRNCCFSFREVIARVIQYCSTPRQTQRKETDELRTF